MNIELDDTPGTREVFEALKGGQHISCDNDLEGLWSEYRPKAAQWQSLFRMLGYELREEHESYCYLVGEGQARSITGMSVFLLVLVRWLLRQGDDPMTAMTARTWTVAAYPHLGDERSREIMRMVGIAATPDIERIEQQLVRHGFARRTATGIGFCLPVRRIVDLCIDTARAEAESQRGDADPTEPRQEEIPS